MLLRQASTVAGCLLIWSQSNANLVVNGDFESSSGVYTVESQNLEGWYIDGFNPLDNVVVVEPTTGFGPPTNSVHLGGLFDLPGTGMHQVLPTVAGQTYRFAFDYWTGGGDSLGSVDVLVNDASLFNELTSGDDVLPRTFDGTFLASGPTEIAFVAGDFAEASHIDNVVVDAVPEPASLAALGVGLLVAMRRRRAERAGRRFTAPADRRS